MTMKTPQSNLPESELLTQLHSTYCFSSLSPADLRVLVQHVVQITLKKDDDLFHQGAEDTRFYLMLKGHLAVSWEDNDGLRIVFDEVSPGDTIGEMQIMVGGKRTASLSATQDSTLLALPREIINRLAQQYTDMLPKMGEVIKLRLRRGQLAMIMPTLFGAYDDIIFRNIESEAEWVHLSGNEVLFHQHDIGDGLYIVVSGRLQAYLEHPFQLVGDITRGECLGELSFLTGEPRTASVRALRETNLLKFSNAAFERIIQRYPMIMKSISKVIIKRLRKTFQSVPETNTSIALVPINQHCIEHFTQHLQQALAENSPTLHLNSQSLHQLIDIPNAASIRQEDPQSIRVKILLDHLESKHRFTLYETDSAVTPWTKWCLERADQIVFVGYAGDDPQLGCIEKHLLEHHKDTPIHQRLVLLHQHTDQLPTDTQHWIKPRHIYLHHHVRLSYKEDFARLARFLSGTAIGVAMSGGGAKGFAHYGVYLALKEAGIPVDMIGGTSMGGHIGAQCAAGMDRETMLDTNHRNLIESNPYKQYILPFISLLSSKKLKNNLRNIFAETHIEDLWLNFFCVSSNLSTSKTVIHRNGLLTEAIRASTAIPGIAEPVLDNGDILIDGGILNNLPADIIRDYCGTVIVIDVSSCADWRAYHTIPSPWQCLLNRLLPFRKKIPFPSIIDMLISSTLLSSTNKASQAKIEADYYIHPPVEKFKLLEFSALEELVNVGYEHAKQEVAQWDIIKTHKR